MQFVNLAIIVVLTAVGQILLLRASIAINKLYIIEQLRSFKTHAHATLAGLMMEWIYFAKDVI